MPCQLSVQMYQSNLGFWILEMQVFYRENVTKIRTVDFLQSCRKMYNNKFYIILADPDISLCLNFKGPLWVCFERRALNSLY